MLYIYLFCLALTQQLGFRLHVKRKCKTDTASKYFYLHLGEKGNLHITFMCERKEKPGEKGGVGGIPRHPRL